MERVDQILSLKVETFRLEAPKVRPGHPCRCEHPQRVEPGKEFFLFIRLSSCRYCDSNAVGIELRISGDWAATVKPTILNIRLALPVVFSFGSVPVVTLMIP